MHELFSRHPNINQLKLDNISFVLNFLLNLTTDICLRIYLMGINGCGMNYIEKKNVFKQQSIRKKNTNWIEWVIVSHDCGFDTPTHSCNSGNSIHIHIFQWMRINLLFLRTEKSQYSLNITSLSQISSYFLCIKIMTISHFSISCDKKRKADKRKYHNTTLIQNKKKKVLLSWNLSAFKVIKSYRLLP